MIPEFEYRAFVFFALVGLVSTVTAISIATYWMLRYWPLGVA